MDIFQMSVSASVLIIIIAIARLFCISRLPKLTFRILWGIVMLKLLVPITVEIPISEQFQHWILGQDNAITSDIANEQQEGLFVPTQSTEYNEANMFDIFAALVENDVNEQLAGNETLESYAEHEQVTSNETAPYAQQQQSETMFSNVEDQQTSKQVKLMDTLPFHGIWLFVTISCILFYVISYRRSSRKMREALPIQDDYFLTDWLRNNSLKRPVSIKVWDRTSTPFTYGIFSPKIILPKTMDYSDKNQMNYVLFHELVHIKRHDNLWKVLCTITLCIHWFNPLVWMMYLLFNRDLEIACDEKVIRMLGEKEIQSYANALIHLAERKSSISLLCNGFGKNAVKERIVMIMRYKKASIISIAVASTLTISLTAFTAASGITVTHDSTDMPRLAQEFDKITITEAEEAIEEVCQEESTEHDANWDSLVAVGNDEALDSLDAAGNQVNANQPEDTRISHVNENEAQETRIPQANENETQDVEENQADAEEPSEIVENVAEITVETGLNPSQSSTETQAQESPKQDESKQTIFVPIATAKSSDEIHQAYASLSTSVNEYYYQTWDDNPNMTMPLTFESAYEKFWTSGGFEAIQYFKTLSPEDGSVDSLTEEDSDIIFDEMLNPILNQSSYYYISGRGEWDIRFVTDEIIYILIVSSSGELNGFSLFATNGPGAMNWMTKNNPGYREMHGIVQFKQRNIVSDMEFIENYK